MRIRKMVAGLALGMSLVMSVNALAVGSITGIIENAEADFSGATLADGTAISADDGYAIEAASDFKGDFFETEEGEALLADVIEPLNNGEISLQDAVTNVVRADDTSTAFDLTDYKMLTQIFDLRVVYNDEEVIEGVRGIKVSFDVTNLDDQEIVVLHYSTVLGAWEVYDDVAVDGQTVTVTFTSLSPVCVLYNAADESPKVGDLGHTLPAVLLILAVGSGAAVLYRRKRA